MKRLLLALVSGVLAVALISCGGDDSESTSTVTVTIGSNSIEVSGEPKAGAVEVMLAGELNPESEVSFSRVAEGTSESDFRAGISGVLEGDPIPEFLIDNAGVYALPQSQQPATVLLKEGSYFVWAEFCSGEDGPCDIAITQLELDGDNEGELPPGSGTITARDYSFEIDVKAGNVYRFQNEGPTQFHHAILFNFGDLDPETVEANLPALFSGEEGSPPPEAFANVDFENLEAGASGVFGPGSSGTFNVTLESGTTYALVCFIQDRTGGPPHAFAHNMYRAFTVE